MSIKKFPDDVTKLVNDELRKSYIIGPFTKPPFDNYQISPEGIVEGKYLKNLNSRHFGGHSQTLILY